MTREEAIEILGHVVPFATQNGEKIAEAIDMAIEALQFADRSPRTVKLTEDIKITLDEEAYEIGYTHGQMADRPKGEWIDRSDGGRIIYPWWESCECNQCGEYGSEAYNFCPNCGAYMRSEKEYLDKTFPEHEGGKWLDITDMMTGESEE